MLALSNLRQARAPERHPTLWSTLSWPRQQQQEGIMGRAVYKQPPLSHFVILLSLCQGY